MNRLKRKEQAFIDDMLPIVVFVLMVATLLFSFVNYNSAIYQKTTLNRVARDYLLKMETTGYLTPDMATSLFNELYNLGYRGSSSGGGIEWENLQDTTAGLYTTIVEVGYGNEICLNLNIYAENTLFTRTKIDDDGIATIDLFSPQFYNEYVPITVTYYSMSKQ